jgi:hypothetical protein
MPATGLLVSRSRASETVGADGQFHSMCRIALPLIGTLVHYLRQSEAGRDLPAAVTDFESSTLWS